ncbi:MAG: anaerobic sulfatase maturase [Anaerolineae bacterium]
MPSPRSLLIKPASADCNLHCAYCFYHERPTDPYSGGPVRRMSGDVLETLISQAMKLDRTQAIFGWQGGEPTLCGLGFFEQVVALQQRYGFPGQSVSNGLQTNGLLLDEDWARFLRRYNFLVGVSLDGPEQYHDRYRVHVNGAGTHARVMESIARLERQGVAFNILSVVNRETAGHGAEIYDYLVDQGFRYLQFIPCVEMDPGTGEIAEFSVTPEQYGNFLCEVFDRWYAGGYPEVSIRDFDSILGTYVGQGASVCCYQERCGSYLVVEYNGDLYPCDFYVRQDLLLGNLSEITLQNAFRSDKLERFVGHKSDPREECQRCAWQRLCRQGCPRFLGLGGVGRHYLCRALQQFFAHSYDGFMQLRAELGSRANRDQVGVSSPVAFPVGRNDSCPCGSGKKVKQCCGLTRPAWLQIR